ncbi:MAG: metal-sensing transcriptional repressor [Nitrososphaerota archaeon]|nr:metal-sensing transcriptional repressor [Nitrososphaerota archaeon]
MSTPRSNPLTFQCARVSSSRGYGYSFYDEVHPVKSIMSSHKRKQVADRMAKIHGHVHGIMEMLEEGRPYSEIVQQITAVKSGLDSAVQVIVDDLVEDCVAKKNSRQEMTQSVLELRQVIDRSR